MNKLARLRELTTVVADTGDIESIRKYAPVDATTNPSLLLKAAQEPAYRPLVYSAIEEDPAAGGSAAQVRVGANHGRQDQQCSGIA